MPLKLYEEQVPKHIIGIAAGKGGVGKSTVTVHLAEALQKLGYSVGILDADIYGPSIRKMVPEDELPSQVKGILFPARSRGMSVISIAHFRKENEAAAVRAPIVSSAVTQFLKNISWGSLDFLLIDFPPGTGDIQLTLCQQAKFSGVLMVTTPQEISVMDVRKAMHLFQQTYVPILGVIENMSYYTHPGTSEKVFMFGKGGGKQLAHEENVPYLGEIPLDPAIGKRAEQGQTVISEKTEAAKAFMQLGTFVANRLKEKQGTLIKNFHSNDSKTLILEWEDGLKQTISLSTVQKNCPCAKCQNADISQNDVVSLNIEAVGHYGLRIQFNTGCSNGLYPFTLLRSLQKTIEE